MLRWIAALLLLISQPSLGSAPWSDEIHANAQLRSTGYAQAVPVTDRALETGRMELEASAKYTRAFKLKFDPIVEATPFDHSISERYWADLPEGYFQYQGHSWTLQLGYNTFTWGVTDGYNPLDVVSARRYEDPLRAEKLGAPSISLKKDFDNISLEGIFIPWQRQSVLPGNNSRWLPREIFATKSVGSGNQSALLFLPSNLDYFYEPSQQRDNALEKNFGLRVQASSLAPGLDVSLEGFEGAGSTPAIDVGATGTLIAFQPIYEIQANSLITLTPVYYRQRVYGGSLVYANFGMIFKFESAITRVISKGADLPGSTEEYVFGMERPFTIGSNDLTLLFQGTYARHSDPLDNSTTSLSRIFDRAIILGGRYPFSEKLTTVASFLYDTESHGEIAHLEASYSLTDAWKLGVAGDGLWGGASTPIGTYHKNDRAIVTVSTSI